MHTTQLIARQGERTMATMRGEKDFMFIVHETILFYAHKFRFYVLLTHT